MNSTVKILKIFGFVRKRLPKASMVVGWQIANKVKKSRAQHGVIGFHKTGNEVFTVICMIEFKLKLSLFSMMQVCGYPSLMLRLFGPAVRNFRFDPIDGGGLGRLIFMFVNLIQWTI